MPPQQSTASTEGGLLPNIRHRARACLGTLAALACLALAPGAHAACTYKRLGSIPAEWVGSRLMIDGSINDHPMTMAVDTGLWWTTVSGALATKLDLVLAHVDGYEVGVGGKSQTSQAPLEELSIGRFQWRNAKVNVAWQEAGLPDALVGANLLLAGDVEFDGQQLVFFSPSGCDDAELGYWADDVPWVRTEPVTRRDLRANLTVQVNGQPVRALVDSGAPHTILDSGAARRLGVDPDDPRAQLGQSGGIGAHVTTKSVATFDTIAIGPEIVRHPRIEVESLWQAIRDDVHEIDTERYVAEQPEMLLGADFIRSHRLLFAASQRRLYFSYLGGEVFTAPAPVPKPTASR
jgi:predicted aspartyl protease